MKIVINHWSITILNEILQFVNEIIWYQNTITLYFILYFIKNLKKGIDFIIKIWHNNFR